MRVHACFVLCYRLLLEYLAKRISDHIALIQAVVGYYGQLIANRVGVELEGRSRGYIFYQQRAPDLVLCYVGGHHGVNVEIDTGLILDDGTIRQGGQ